MGVLLKVPCFLYPVTYWSQGTVLILVLLLPVLRCITFQVSVSPLCCSTCPFWTPPPGLSPAAWPGRVALSQRLFLTGQRAPPPGVKDEGHARCKEIRQVLHQLSQVRNKRKRWIGRCRLQQCWHASGAPTEPRIFALFESTQPCMIPGDEGCQHEWR